jgi:hypothetical protein
MKLNPKDRNTLRSAAAVADAQLELVTLQKNRREGRPISASAAGPLLALLLASLAMGYFSVMAITSENEAGQASIYLSGDIEQPLTPG